MRRLVDLLLVVVPAAVLLLLPRLLAAQGIPLDSGVKVRLTGRVTGGVPRVARIIETRADTMVVDDGGRERLILLASELDALEVLRASRARQDAMTLGAVAGLAGGIAAAVHICRGRGGDCWAFEVDGNDDGDLDDDEDHWVPGIGALTMGAAAVVGAAIGAALTPSRWKRVAVVAVTPVRVGVATARHGLGVMVRMPFGGPPRSATR